MIKHGVKPMSTIKGELEKFIPQGDGYNSDYANTLVEAVEYIEQLEDRVRVLEKVLSSVLTDINTCIEIETSKGELK